MIVYRSEMPFTTEIKQSDSLWSGLISEIIHVLATTLAYASVCHALYFSSETSEEVECYRKFTTFLSGSCCRYQY